MKTLEPNTCHVNQIVNGSCDPVIIWSYLETHWYDFNEISVNPDLYNSFTINYFETYQKLFPQQNQETNKDYQNRLYVYSDVFEKTYFKSNLSLGKYSKCLNIPKENVKPFNGTINSVYCEEYNCILLCDLQLMTNLQKTNDYFKSFDSDTKELLMLVFDIEEGETGYEYFKRLKYYFMEINNSLWLYRLGKYKEPTYTLQESIVKPVKSAKMTDDGTDMVNVIINGTVNSIPISDTETHHYDFKYIQENKLYGVLKNGYWKFYSKIFAKYEGEKIQDYTDRLKSYFIAFETGYKKYLKSLK